MANIKAPEEWGKNWDYTLEMDSYIDKLPALENSIMAGWDSKEKKFFPHSSIEGGAKTIGFGHKLKKGEEKKYNQGLTYNEAISLMKKDVMESYRRAYKRYENRRKDGYDFIPWNNLSNDQKVVLTELAYNKGGASIEFMSAMSSGDSDTAINRLRQRGVGDITFTKRNELIIDNYIANDPIYKKRAIEKIKPDETVIDSVIKMEDVKRPLY